MINATELEETHKWNAPEYALNGNNVLGLGSLRSILQYGFLMVPF